MHFCQALDGIGRAHKLGIVHRDIKPANVMITEDGSIKVMDFGIARVLGTARMTKQGNIIGTIEYMSPEAIQGHEVDARADIYSLGILLYEMLTGRVPFEADTEFSLMMAQIQQAPPPPRTFAPHIPIGVEQAIMRSLAKKPEARFQTAADFRVALEGGGLPATTLPTAAMPTAPPTRLGEPPTAPQSQQVTMPIGAGSDPMGLSTAMGNQPKETRLGGTGYGQPQYQPAPAPYAQPAPANYQVAHPPIAPAHPSFFSRLNWKHYSAAAMILIILLAVPVVLIAVLKGQVSPATPPPAPERPAASSTPTPPPAENSAPAPNPMASQPAIAPGGEPQRAPSGPSDASYPGGDTASGDKKGKTATNRREGDTAAAREKARKAAEARRLLNQ
jgi:serine/threonine-protein kinase